MSVHDIDWRNRVGQIGICIWRAEDRHRGYGRAVTQTIVSWATGQAGLERLEAWMVEGNTASLHLFQVTGLQMRRDAGAAVAHRRAAMRRSGTWGWWQSRAAEHSVASYAAADCARSGNFTSTRRSRRSRSL